MQDYILNVLEPLNFEVVYDFEQLKMENHIPVPVKENLYLIFKEAVNNIAKYSNGNKVEITMHSSASDFKFTIQDNGNSGKSMKKTGHGLRNMEMRAQRMGGRVDISDEDGFKITLMGKLTMN
jgi:signal transduction histidine kinase